MSTTSCSPGFNPRAFIAPRMSWGEIYLDKTVLQALKIPILSFPRRRGELWVKSKTLSHCECENWKSTNDSGLCGTLPSPQKCPFAKWSLFKLKIKTSEVKLVDHWSTTRDRLDVGKLNQFPVNQRNTFDKIIELHRWRENWGKVVYKALKM